MTTHDRLSNALTRIASATSVIRTRQTASVRAAAHNGHDEGLDEIAGQLQAVADQLWSIIEKDKATV